MYKTGGQLLGVNGSIYKFNTSNASIIKPLDPQPPAVNSMCIDAPNNRLFVALQGDQVWVYDTITLTRTNIITGLSNGFCIRKDPNPENNRVVVYDFNNAWFVFIDLTTLAVSNTKVSALRGKFEYDSNLERNQLILTAGNTITILNATTFGLVQQIVDPLFQNLGQVRRNAYNLDEVYIFTADPTRVVVLNLIDLSYTFRTFSNGAADADADPNLANNKIYAVYSSSQAIYTASDLGFVQTLNLIPSYLIVTDPVVANHRLFMAGGPLLYAVTLG